MKNEVSAILTLDYHYNQEVIRQINKEIIKNINYINIIIII